MAGYHRQTNGSDNLRNLVEIQDPSEQMDALNLDDRALREDTPEASEKRLRDNMGLGEMLDVERNNQLVKFAQDLLLSAGAITAEDSLIPLGQTKQPESDVVREIKRRLSASDAPDQDEETDDIGDLPERSSGGQRSGFVRGSSEPPSLGPSDAPSGSDYTWEWGGFPSRTPADEKSNPLDHPQIASATEMESPGIMERPSLARTHDPAVNSLSAPVVPKLSDMSPAIATLKAHSKHLERQQSAPAIGFRNGHAESPLTTAGVHLGGLLKNDESDAYKFILEIGASSHVFELGLGGDILAGDEVEDNLDEVSHTKRRWQHRPVDLMYPFFADLTGCFRGQPDYIQAFCRGPEDCRSIRSCDPL
jgi:hypothetical protein